MDLTRQLTNLYLLTRVIDAGGFSAAAREIGTTRSLLSRHIIALEKALDTRLLHRDARHFAVTPAGERVYRQAVLMCDAAQAALAAPGEHARSGHGSLRVSMRDALLPLMSGVLTMFAGSHPHMQLTTSVHEQFDVLLQQRADVMLHLGNTLPDSGDLVAYPLGRARLVVVASPALLERLGYPRHPDAIDPRHCLGYTGHGLAAEWSLRGARSPHRHTRLVSDRITPMIEAARSGVGLVQLPMYACHEDLANGRLAPVLEAFEAAPLPLHALTLTRRGENDAARNFIRFAREQMTGLSPLGILPA